MSALQGIVAGTVGTAVLDAVTYADMAVTGRAASNAPTHTVIATAAGLGVDLPAEGNRTDAYGPLGGLAAGAAVGVLAATARRVGLRLPLLAEAAVVGVAAMVATDGPMHWSGVTDVRTWSAGDWARDAVPHLAFGLAVSGTLRALERDDDSAAARGGADGGTSVTVPGSVAGAPTTSRRRVLARSLAIGLATGARSTLALVPPAASSGRVALAVGAAGMVAGELTADKLPSTPSRLTPAPALARVALGAVGALSVARRQGQGGALPLLAGAAGAVIGTVGGHAFRGLCADRGVPVPGALAEDALALTLTAWATRG